ARRDPADRRRRELGLIHAGAKALGLDEPAYRAMLEHLTGKTSARDLDAAERAAVIEHLRANGFRAQDHKRLGNVVAKKVAELKQAGATPQQALIQSLWDELVRLGAMRYGIHARLDTFLHRMGCPVSHPRFLTPAQANKVIEALKDWRRRVRRAKGLD
ncbi:MAG: phage protein GemA/Gp16 family protein, partial [Kiloniellaceae bacterium]